jgi:hypothetical protein
MFKEDIEPVLLHKSSNLFTPSGPEGLVYIR